MNVDRTKIESTAELKRLLLNSTKELNAARTAGESEQHIQEIKVQRDIWLRQYQELNVTSKRF